MGARCQVKVGGLEGRVKWERTELAELTLYIPYQLELSDCVYQPDRSRVTNRAWFCAPS